MSTTRDLGPISMLHPVKVGFTFLRKYVDVSFKFLESTIFIFEGLLKLPDFHIYISAFDIFIS